MSRRWKRWRRSRPCSKRLSRVYASKGPVVEEWADRRFFRPVGWWLAKTLAPTGISADDVTLASLVLGVAAGHFFFYSRPWLNALGVALFVISDVLASADGQLERLRGTSRVRPRWRARSPAAPCRCRYSWRGRSGSARLLRAARGSHKTSASSYSPSPLYRGGRPRIAGS